MIKQKDVIRIKIPYPTINDKMALNSHMYICRNSDINNYELVKCQTLKPYMLINSPMVHYWDEIADITRNPFLHTTRIDCDKIFITRNVVYDDKLKTLSRPDVCDDVLESIEKELQIDGFDEVEISEEKLKIINSLIR